MYDIATEQRRQVITATKNDAIRDGLTALRLSASVNEIREILVKASERLARLGENVNSQSLKEEVETWHSLRV